MSSSTLINNFGQISRPFDRNLTINFFLTRIANHAESFFKKVLDKLITSAIVSTQDLFIVLKEVYVQAETMDPEYALSILPTFVSVRKSVTKQKVRYAEIDYADNQELKKEFLRLVKLVNHLEARLQRAAYSNTETEPMPAYFKERMKKNRNRIMANVLSEEANS